MSKALSSILQVLVLFVVLAWIVSEFKGTDTSSVAKTAGDAAGKAAADAAAAAITGVASAAAGAVSSPFDPGGALGGNPDSPGYQFWRSQIDAVQGKVPWNDGSGQLSALWAYVKELWNGSPAANGSDQSTVATDNSGSTPNYYAPQSGDSLDGDSYTQELMSYLRGQTV